MNRAISKRFVLNTAINKLSKKCESVKLGHQIQRCLATVEEVFPSKSDFPGRHIGPRKTDVVTMLNSIGFKVSVLGIVKTSGN